MYTTSMRAQAFGSYSFNFTAALLFILGLLYHLNDPRKPTCNFKVQLENNRLQFFPNIDLTNDYKPGLKQIFLYAKMINAEGEEMVWSLIVKRSIFKRLTGKFHGTYKVLTPIQGSKFELWGNYFPYVGIITFKKLGEYELK